MASEKLTAVKSRPPFYARKYLVHPKSQLSIAFYCFLFISIIVASLYWAVSMMIRELQSPQMMALVTDQSLYAQLLTTQTVIISRAFAMVYFISIPFVFFGFIFLSNRIVGPIQRIIRILKEYDEGKEFHPIVFRNGDLYGELADSINAHMESKHGKR